MAAFRERLLYLFEYRPEDGALVNLTKSNKRGVGQVAGCLRSDGYVHVKVDWVAYKAHQLVWLMLRGELVRELDHRDRNRSNNKIENLRKATRPQNVQNSKIRCDNRSGVRGVSWSRQRSKWCVTITVSGKLRYLGFRASLEDAAALRKAAELEYFGEFAVGEAT